MKRTENDKMDAINTINRSGWHDWLFDGIHLNSKKAIVKIFHNLGSHYNLDGSMNEYYSDTHIAIHCMNCVEVTYIGRWDESVIESIRIDTLGGLGVGAQAGIASSDKKALLANSAQNCSDEKWYLLCIKLIDGNAIRIVCESFFMDNVNEAHYPNDRQASKL